MIRVIGLTVLVSALSACSSGSSDNEEPPKNNDVQLSGIVYDAELSGARVELLLGDTVVASTLSDDTGSYNFNLSLTEADSSKLAIVRATRGKFKLRSLLGTANALVQNKDSSGKLSGENFSAANITNVSTSMAAIMEQQNSGTLPSTQTAIETLRATIQSTPALQTKVKQIAAAVKAVIDYEATHTAADTDQLAKDLAASATLATDLTTVISTNTAGLAEADLITKVESDPKLATQLPESPISTIGDLANRYYVTGKKGGPGRLFVFGAGGTTVTLANAANISSGGNGLTGSASFDAMTGVLTMDFSGNAGPTITATIQAGNLNAFSADVVEDATNKGSILYRRIIPVVENIAGDTVNQITEGTALATTLLVDFRNSRAIRFPSVCDGTTNDGWMANIQGKLSGVSCNNYLGMMIITPPSNPVGVSEMIFGLMADGWDGVSVTNAMNVSVWEADVASGTVLADYGRAYIPQGATIPKQYDPGATGIVGNLRILRNGNSQLLFVTANDTTGDNVAGGSVDIYKSNGTTEIKNHLVQGTHTDFGALLVNGSIKTTTDFASAHASTSVSVNLGRHAGGGLNALFQPHNPTAPGAIITRLQYSLSVLASSDVSGKTFELRNLGDATDITVVTFKTDGTGVVTDSTGTQTMAWAVGPSVSGTTTVFDYTHGQNTVNVTMPDGEVVYLFADKTAGTGSFVGASYSLKAGAFVSMGGFLAVERLLF